MKVRILDVWDWDREVINMCWPTDLEVLGVVELEWKDFDILINCDKEKRLKRIDELLWMEYLDWLS